MKPIAIVALSLLVGLLSACSEAPPEKPKPRPVISIVVGPRQIENVGFAGTVAAAQSTDLGFQILGRMTARNVDVGDFVTKGQELAHLNPLALDLAVSKAEADLASGAAKLDLARANEMRQAALLRTNNTAKEAFEQTVQARQATEATVRQLQAELSKVRQQRGYADLIAQIDGVVSARSAEVGQVVSAGQTVLTVASLEALDAVIDIPDNLSQYLQSGTLFDVILQANTNITVEGRVREVSPQADASTRTRRTKIALNGAPKAFRLGSTITARPRTTVSQAIWLPASAIGSAAGKDFVWVVNQQGSEVQQRPVSINRLPDGSIQVREGLSAGERVVIAGVQSLTDKQAVRLIEGSQQ